MCCGCLVIYFCFFRFFFLLIIDDNEKTIDDLPVVDGVIDFRDNHGCCRDCYCLLVVAACIIGMIVVFAFGFQTGFFFFISFVFIFLYTSLFLCCEGDPRKLYYPIDAEFFSNCVYPFFNYIFKREFLWV
jgi:hypothetical protein